MANDWFVKINNAEHGPLTSERLKQLAQEGKVTPETPLKKGPSGTWVTANHLKGLFPVAASGGTPAKTAPPPKPDSRPSMPTARPHSATPVVPSSTVPPARPAEPWKATPTPVSQSPIPERPPLPSRPSDETQRADAFDDVLTSVADSEEATDQRQRGSHDFGVPPGYGPPAQGRVLTGSSRKANGSGPSLLYLAAGGIVLVALAVGVTLWATGVLSYPHSAYRNAPQSAHNALNAVKKVEARTEVGINSSNYSTVVGEAWVDVKLFAESPEGKTVPDFSVLLVSAMAKHKIALDVWQTKIENGDGAGCSDAALHECWRAAAKRLKVAESLISEGDVKVALSQAAILRKADESYEATMRSVISDLIIVQKYFKEMKRQKSLQELMRNDSSGDAKGREADECIIRMKKNVATLIKQDFLEP